MAIADVHMVQSACKHMNHLVNVRLSVDSNDVNASSFVSIENDFFARPTLKRAKMDMCARTTFQNVTECSHIEQLSIAWCQMQELTHLLLYVPDLHTLRASICGLDDGKSPEEPRPSIASHCDLVENWTQTIQEIPPHRFPLGLKSLKLVVDSMRFDTLLLLLDKLTQLRALWLLLDEHDYLDVDKWQTLFQSSLAQVDQLDLTIALTYPFPTVVIPGQILIYSAPHVACTKFNSKFWLDRGWRAKINEYDYCVRLTVSNDAAPSWRRTHPCPTVSIQRCVPLFLLYFSVRFSVAVVSLEFQNLFNSFFAFNFSLSVQCMLTWSVELEYWEGRTTLRTSRCGSNFNHISVMLSLNSISFCSLADLVRWCNYDAHCRETRSLPAGRE